MKQYVSAVCLGITSASDDEVILSCYGPRGGTQATVGMTPTSARALLAELTSVLERFGERDRKLLSQPREES